MGAQVGLGEGDAEGGVGGEVEFGVAFSPVFYYGDVDGGGGGGLVDLCHLEEFRFEEGKGSGWGVDFVMWWL